MTTKILVGVASVAIIALIIGSVVVLGRPTGTATPQAKAPASAQYSSKDVLVGGGAEAKEGSSITVKYTGKLDDGTVFDSTDKQGGTPATFTLSKGSLIDGWIKGIPGMKVGGKRTLVIPPELGYGDKANGAIPAGSTLTFDIELVDVK